MIWPRRDFDYLRPAARRVPLRSVDALGGPAPPVRATPPVVGRSPFAREELDWPAQPESERVAAVRPPAPPAPRPAPPAPRPPAPPAPPTNAQPDDDAPSSAEDELVLTRQRLERERDRVLAETRANVVSEMLPVLDNLDRSLDAANSGPSPALIEGLRLVRKQFEDALTRMGLERIDSLGQAFDPALFDAVAIVEVSDPTLDGTVADEWQRGYRLGDRIVRRPKVRVAQWSRV